MKKKNPAAVSLGRKGGKAALRTMTPDQRHLRALHAVMCRERLRRARGKKD